MFQYRQVLVRLRQGDSDRDIARSRLMGRKKVGKLREPPYTGAADLGLTLHKCAKSKQRGLGHRQHNWRLVMNYLALSIVATLALVASAPAAAETIKRNAVGCISEELLDEAVGYANKGDDDGLAALAAAGDCVFIRAGETISVISPGFLVATIRYKGVKLFTPSESVR
ncbi:MAG TPA: hypothetical protein DCQ33_13650 [Nitrospira sp.]|nr:hypothetical protein [Nitrospira sp.]